MNVIILTGATGSIHSQDVPCSTWAYSSRTCNPWDYNPRTYKPRAYNHCAHL